MSFVDTSVYDACWVQADQPFKTAAGQNTLLFENKKYTLPIGQPVMVPRGVVNLWLGNPDARDHPTDKDLRHRTRELARVSKKWGNAVGAPAIFPDIKAWSLDQQLLPTIVADPSGESVAPPDPQAVSLESLKAQQRQMAQALATLRQFAAQEGLDLGEITGLEVSSPTPDAGPPLLTPPTAPAPTSAPAFVPAEAPAPVADIPDAPAWATEPAPAPDAASLPQPPDPTVAKKAPAKKAPPRTKTPVS